MWRRLLRSHLLGHTWDIPLYRSRKERNQICKELTRHMKLLQYKFQRETLTDSSRTVPSSPAWWAGSRTAAAAPVSFCLPCPCCATRARWRAWGQSFRLDIVDPLPATRTWVSCRIGSSRVCRTKWPTRSACLYSCPASPDPAASARTRETTDTSCCQPWQSASAVRGKKWMRYINSLYCMGQSQPFFDSFAQCCAPVCRERNRAARTRSCLGRHWAVSRRDS